MDALQIATWHVEVTGCGCACGNDYCIVLAGKCRIAMHFLTISELDALLLQKPETAIDDDLAQLEVRNTIAKQSSGSLVLFEDCDTIAHLVQSVGCCQSRRTSTDDSHLLAISFRHTQWHESFAKGSLGNRCLVLAIGGRLMQDEVEHASLFAKCRADTSSEFRERIGGRKQLVCQFPITPIERIVPFRRFIAQWAGPVAKGHTAIHATRGLLSSFTGIERLFHFAKVMYSIVYWSISCLLTPYLQECFWISHIFLFYKYINIFSKPVISIIALNIRNLLTQLGHLFLLEHTFVFDGHHLDEVFDIMRPVVKHSKGKF